MHTDAKSEKVFKDLEFHHHNYEIVKISEKNLYEDLESS